MRGDLPRLQADHVEAGMAQPVGQVLRQCPGLEPDLPDLTAEAPQRAHDHVDLGRHLRFVLNRAGVIDHADRHGTQRHIDTGEVLHRDSPSQVDVLRV